MAIRDRPGVDILRGCLTWEDDTWEHAALREAREEGNVTLHLVSLAAVIESRRSNASEDQITYTLVITARIKSIDPYQPWHGVPKRVFLSKEQLLKRFSARRAKDLRINCSIWPSLFLMIMHRRSATICAIIYNNL